MILNLREKGLTSAHYLSPLASEHALDDYYGDQTEHLQASKAEAQQDEEMAESREE